MVVRVLDKREGEEIIERRKKLGIDQKDEVWEGVYYVMPEPTIDHQRLVKRLIAILTIVVDEEARGEVFPGTNVSDRRSRWDKNFRAPDVVVVLEGSRAKDCRTHWFGGPDFVVEVQSPGDETDLKIPFYSRTGVRELLIIHRDTRELRLYRHDGTDLAPVETSVWHGKSCLVSTVVPLTFRLVTNGSRRRRTEIRRTDGTPGQWVI